MRLIDADELTNKYGNWYVEEGPEDGFIGDLKHLIDLQPTIAPPAQQWTPCSEGMPDEQYSENIGDFKYILCTTIWGDVRPYKYGTPIGGYAERREE